MKAITSVLITLAAFNTSIVFAQPGSLDLSFGTGGKATASFEPPEDVGRHAALQADGKIVQTGYSYNLGIGVVRYNTNGTLDNTFGGDGKVTTDIGTSYDEGYDVAIQQDGKIVVAGSSYNTSGNSDFAVVRYNTDGSLDNTFSDDGKVTTKIGSSDDVGYSLSIQQDGKIVVAGYSFQGGKAVFALVRYNADGSLDNSFDSDGKVTTAIGNGDDIGWSVTLQPDGKILLAGLSSNGSDYDFALLRYNTNGSLDNSFDGDGKVTTAIGSGDDVGFSVAIQPDGKILMAGYSFNGSDYDFALVRYNSDGSLDKSFDGDGKVTTAIGNSHDLGYSVAVQQNGKIVVAGTSYSTSNSDFALVRYNTNGSLDFSFDGDGKVITDFNNTNDDAASVSLQSDGKIVVAGTTRTSQSVFAVARYNGDAILPVTLISFIATNTGKSVLLNWQTANELNNNYFSVERSANGISFQEIGEVKSKGNSSQPQQYSFEDYNILNEHNYYRLKQVDNDGKFTYSKIVSVDFVASQTIKLYPNPVKNILRVEGLNPSINTTLSIIDVSGKLIQQLTITGSIYAYNLQKLTAGNYYIKIEADKKITILKFIKE